MNIVKILESQLAELEKKIGETFAATMENAEDDTLKKYEGYLKQYKVVEAQLAEAKQSEAAKEMDEEKGKKDPLAEEQKKRERDDKLTEEEENFVKAIRESASFGKRFSGDLPASVASRIQMKAHQYAKIASHCTQYALGGEYTVLVEGSNLKVAYVQPGTAIGETESEPTTIKLGALKIGGIAKLTNELIADASVDLLAYIEEKFAKALADYIDHEILFGAGGETAIRGVVGKATTTTKVAAKTDTFTWKELVGTIRAIKAYRAGAILVLSQEAYDIIDDLIEENTKHYNVDPIKSVKGCTVVVSDQMPDLGSDKVAAIVGNFAYYHLGVRNGVDISVLPELYAASDQTGVKAIERADGDCLPEAFAVLKMAHGA